MHTTSHLRRWHRTALWPRKARDGSITLHHGQNPATVGFKTASTTERKPNNPAPHGLNRMFSFAAHAASRS